MKREFVLAVRTEIAVALKRRLNIRLRSRLQAIDAVLAGEALEKAAALMLVQPNTIKLWLRQVRKHGITSMLAKWETVQIRPPKVNADPAILRAHAASEMDPEKRKRLIALACIAEGLSLNDAAVKSGISDGTITITIRRFQQNGIDAILPPKRRPTGRRPWLGPKQLKAVARFAHTRPQPTAEQFRAYIKAKFGVLYTRLGLKNMLKKRLGIVFNA